MSKGTSRDGKSFRNSILGECGNYVYFVNGELRTHLDKVALSKSARADLIRALGGVPKSEVTPEMVEYLRSRESSPHNGWQRRQAKELHRLLTEDTK